MRQLVWILAMAGLLAGHVAMAAAEEELSEAELQQRLDAARQRLDQAAREIGELSGRLHGDAMEQVIRMVHRHDGKPRAMIGINIGERNENGKVTGVSDKGVVVLGVSPGGPAEKAGLKTDDILVKLNGNSLAGGGKASNDKLTAIMSEVKPGDKVSIEYLRDGKRGTVELETGEMSAPHFSGFLAPGGDKRIFRWNSKEGGPMPPMPPMPAMPHMPAMAPMMPGGFGGLELVALTPKLGEYFNTDKGLLVVRVPETEGLELEEGDVILRIGEREPKDVRHAMRILRSYAPGESAEIEIMRKKRKRKITYTVAESAALGSAHGYRFMAPGADGDFEVVVEMDGGEGDNREVIIRKHKVITGDAPADGERKKVIVKEKDIGT